jgi:glutaredoxin
MSRLLTIVFLAAALFAAWKHFGPSVTQGAAASPARIAALAASTAAADTVIFTTNECPHCAVAKGWLAQNGFAFTECNMSQDARCIDAYRSHGADGTPFLLVRGQPMRDGFDSDQYLALLSR